MESIGYIQASRGAAGWGEGRLTPYLLLGVHHPQFHLLQVRGGEGHVVVDDPGDQRGGRLVFWQKEKKEAPLSLCGGPPQPVTCTENSAQSPRRWKEPARSHELEARPPHLARGCGLRGAENIFQLGAAVSEESSHFKNQGYLASLRNGRSGHTGPTFPHG